MAGKASYIVTKNELAKLFGLTHTAITKWESRTPPIPRLDNGKFDLYQVLPWHREYYEARGQNASSLKDEKTQWEVERLKAQVAKINEESMLRSEHEAISTARANSLRSYLEKSFMSNIGRFAGKTIDELRVLFYPFLSAMMQAYTGRDDAKN